ncbi:MAG: PAS domain S-box protein [Lewinella sp.]|uniref:PAS domain-containing sensor histidine kinase n=1 Tax=Lewinella sp. TaxID=2004506 RepID=UPI003D6BFF76
MGNKRPAKNLDEQRYRVLIDNAQEVVVIFDVELDRFIEANKAAISLLKFSRKELLQLGPSDISLKLYQGRSAADQAKAYIQQALNGGNPSFEWIHIDRDGREIPCEIRLIRFPPYDRSIVRASIIDLTEKRKSEAALIESEDRLKLALKTAGLGCFDWYPEENRTHWDAGMHCLFDLDPSDPIDRNAFFFQCIHPDDKERITGKYKGMLNPESDMNTFETKFRIVRNGNILHMAFSGMVVRTETGKIRRLVGTVQNITSRVLADEQLNNRATLLNNLSDAVILTNENYVVRSWNKAAEKMYGWTEKEVIGQRLGAVLPTQYINGEQQEKVAATFSKEGIWNGEVIQKTKGGEELYILASITALKDEYGNTTGAIGVNRDISDRKRAEIALKESEAFHRAVYDNSLNAVLITDNSGKLNSFNNAASDMLGIKEEALSQMRILDLPITSPSDKKTWFKEILQKGKEVGELTISLPEQEARVAQYYAVQVWENFNMFIFVDITQRKKIEETLKDREERFRTIFNQQFQIMVLLSPEGRVLEINDLPFKVTGSQKDYIGGYVWETPAWVKLPKWQAIIKAQVLKAGQIQETLIAEDAYINTKGELRWADAAYTAIRNEKGDVKYILVQASDITERKQTLAKLSQTQQELSELTNRFQISTRAAKIGIWDWKVQEDVLIWDETMLEIYGISGKGLSIKIKDWQQYLYPDDLGLFQEMIRWNSIGQKELLNTEFRIIRTDGAIRYIKAVGSVQRDAQCQVIRIIGTNWDITQEKEAEQERIRSRQLEARNKELEQFAYVASHDLQEPLRTVISFVGLLKRGYHDKLDEQGHEYLKFVVDASVRMSQLIKGLLEYSRIGTNRQLSLVNINDLIQNIIDDLSAQINQTQANISIKSMPKIMGYETELRLLFQNLVSNAIKFRKAGQSPIIHLGVKDEKSHWLFTVTDQGIGIESAYKEQIFSLFQRLHGIEKYEGTGIGLAHCHKIVDLHGGKIWVESQLHHGSTFFFSISKSVKALD